MIIGYYIANRICNMIIGEYVGANMRAYSRTIIVVINLIIRVSVITIISIRPILYICSNVIYHNHGNREIR